MHIWHKQKYMDRIFVYYKYLFHPSMNIKNYNKALAEQAKKALNFAFTKQSDPTDEQVFFCNDTDSVRYRILAKVHLVRLYFYAVDVKAVWDYCNQHLANKYYKYMKIGLKKDNQTDALEIVIDNQALTALNQNYAPKEQTGITTGKKKFDALFDFLSKKLASIKRHFFASPYEMMLQAIAFNTNNKDAKKLPNLCYNVRQGGSQRIWISFEKNQISVYYGISFQNRSEQQLCRIFFSELVDAKKHVHNPPGITLNETELPKFLIQAFPQEKTQKYNFANGIICFTLFGSLVKKPESIATYLASFRNYVYYHIQAQKCYLHSRVLRRLTAIHKDLTHTKIQPFALN